MVREGCTFHLIVVFPTLILFEIKIECYPFLYLAYRKEGGFTELQTLCVSHLPEDANAGFE